MSQNILHVENITMQFGGVVAIDNLIPWLEAKLEF